MTLASRDLCKRINRNLGNASRYDYFAKNCVNSKYMQYINQENFWNVRMRSWAKLFPKSNSKTG